MFDLERHEPPFGLRLFILLSLYYLFFKNIVLVLNLLFLLIIYQFCRYIFYSMLLYILGEEVLAGRGEYSQKYDTLASIGKGAFGFVKLAQRKCDGLEVS